MPNGTGHALHQRAYDQGVQKADYSRGQEIDEESRSEFLGPLVERLGQDTRRPETQHGSPKLKWQVDFIVRMRIAQITRLFCPRLPEKPKESDIHENSRKPQRLVEIPRHVQSWPAQANPVLIRESPVDSDDCRTQEEIVPVRVFDPVQKIAERRNNLIQSVVNPRSRPEKVVEVFEIKLALVSEFGKEANRDRGKQ